MNKGVVAAFVILILIVAGVSIFYVPLLAKFGFSEPNSASDLGAAFSAMNAVFSGLALLGVIGAVYFQGIQVRGNTEQFEKTLKLQEAASHLLAIQAKIAAWTSIHDSSWNQLYSIDSRINALTGAGAGPEAKRYAAEKSAEREEHSRVINEAKREIAVLKDQLVNGI